MRTPPPAIAIPHKARAWPYQIFWVIWLVSAIIVYANFHALTARHAREMSVIQHLGGVPWQYQGDADSEWYAVRHDDGFFGLISINATGFSHFLLGFGIVPLLAAALIHWRWRAIVVAPVMLFCFMAPQLIVLAVSLAAGPDFPGGLFEMTLDPAARTATGWTGTIPLCQITGGDAVPSGRWIDVDLTVNGKPIILDSFHETSASDGLLDEVAAAIQAGCPGKVETTR